MALCVNLAIVTKLLLGMAGPTSPMVAALIDWLTFRAHVLDMNGDSYWLKAVMQKRTRQGSSKIHERLVHFFH